MSMLTSYQVRAIFFNSLNHRLMDARSENSYKLLYRRCSKGKVINRWEDGMMDRDNLREEAVG